MSYGAAVPLNDSLVGKSVVGYGNGAQEKLTFVYDADGSIGIVMEFSEGDFGAYSLPDLALVGAFQTKGQAAQASAPVQTLKRAADSAIAVKKWD